MRAARQLTSRAPWLPRPPPATQTLLSWNADIAQSALKRFHAVVGEELKAQGGYLVEAVDGLFLAAFLRPFKAISWALECNDLMIKQAWPDELLTHELCEELVISSPTRNGDMLNMVVFRGPRLKTGVDTGQVLGEVHAMTGRMTYRGKVMNRAARIASTASTGQVLCSADTWELAQARDAAALGTGKITSSSLGQFRLKGVADRIEIMHCRKAASAGERQRRASTLMVHCGGEGWNLNVDGHGFSLLAGGNGASNGNGAGAGLRAAPAALKEGPLQVAEGDEGEEDDDGGLEASDDEDAAARGVAFAATPTKPPQVPQQQHQQQRPAAVPADAAAVVSPDEVVVMSNNPVADGALEGDSHP